MKVKKIVFLLIVFFLFPILSVSAYTPKYLSQYAKEINEAEKQIVEGGVEVREQQISTVFNGVISDKTAWNNHTVQWVTTPSENTDIFPVVWSTGSLENWAPKTVLEMAADYEKQNPGYIVVAAINGDFYYNKETELNGKTYEPCNYHVQEGDVLRASYYTDDLNFGLLGFKDNGEYVTGNPTKSDSMYLKKITDNETVDLSAVTSTNTQPTGDGVFVFTKELSGTIDLTGYTVYKGITSLYRKYNDGYFVKGKVAGVENVTNLSSVPSGTFYIATKSVTLNVDEEIKVEYNLTGGTAGAKNVIGYIYQCLKDGNTLGQNLPTSVLGGYLTKTYTRAAIGFKEDGSIVLMTVDGSGGPANNKEGTTLFQTGELLKIMGCVDGFNLDGGGSATLAARINGRLTLVNNPTDGSTRKVGNAILLVMRNPNFNIPAAIGNSITIEQKAPVVDGTMENIKVIFDNKTYDMTSDKLEITGLDKNSEYGFTIEYDIKNPDGSIVHGITEKYYRTTEDYVMPVLEEFVEASVDIAEVTLKYKVDVDKEDLAKIYIKYGSNKIELERTSGKVKIENIDTLVKNIFTLVVELNNGLEFEMGSITYEASTIPSLDNEEVDDSVVDINPEENKTGCKKEVSHIVISLIGLTGLLVLAKKRK
ncbi:MAG: phosphodiester glycosidase family protein [Bacilli bacterium]|nr:phosphodiester glycosidase family protein [Bacilli bacterium]